MKKKSKIKNYFKKLPKLQKSLMVIGLLFILVFVLAHVAIANVETEIPNILIEHKVPEKELPMGEWIMREIEKAGLNKWVAYCVLYGESRLNPDAININKNGTFDGGIWQINSIHKNISTADKFDYKKATKWTIEKVKHDGNWNAWYAFRDNNCGMFGSTFNK